jgi:hypothetical protein
MREKESGTITIVFNWRAFGKQLPKQRFFCPFWDDTVPESRNRFDNSPVDATRRALLVSSLPVAWRITCFLIERDRM